MRELGAQPDLRDANTHVLSFNSGVPVLKPLPPWLPRAPDHVLSSLADRHAHCLQETEQARGVLGEHESCILALMHARVLQAPPCSRERDKENSCCPALVGLQMGGWRWEGPSGDQVWHSVCPETLAQPAFSLTLCPAVDWVL